MPSTAAAKAKAKRLPKILIFSGLVFLLSGIAIFFLTFAPAISQEVRYAVVRPDPKPKTITPIDTDFGIVIPKIGANAKVVANVNSYNEREYQWALTKGVAHARGTVFPGQSGNVFIFAHSAGNFYEANQFNAVFYLLDKMEKDDDIFLFYKNEKFRYVVTEKKLVSASDIQYLSDSRSGPILTLMTCWPPGTTLKRLIVLGKIVP